MRTCCGELGRARSRLPPCAQRPVVSGRAVLALILPDHRPARAAAGAGAGQGVPAAVPGLRDRAQLSFRPGEGICACACACMEDLSCGRVGLRAVLDAVASGCGWRRRDGACGGPLLGALGAAQVLYQGCTLALEPRHELYSCLLSFFPGQGPKGTDYLCQAWCAPPAQQIDGTAASLPSVPGT